VSVPEKNWFAVDVTVEADAAEAVESAFNILDSIGTEINNLRKQNEEPVTVTGYFNDLPLYDRLKAVLNDSLVVYSQDIESVVDIRTREVRDADWLAEWKRHWRPTAAGKFVIAPPWSDVGDTEKIIIRIEPNMAFGTGTHETTRLCLEAISRSYSSDQTFLDVGTGTGILAIAAAKIAKTSSILAFETDADSVGIARQNAQLNDVGGRIDIRHGTVQGTDSACDFVCANLTLDVIMPLLPLLLDKAKQTLVLSGILAEQTDEIMAELTKLGISDREIYTTGEWISVVISRI
jgi:ribosomal protein L11 methyltransferase